MAAQIQKLKGILLGFKAIYPGVGTGAAVAMDHRERIQVKARTSRYVSNWPNLLDSGYF